MNSNPLFPGNTPDEPAQPSGYLLPGKQGRIEPPKHHEPADQPADNGSNPAADLIREKLQRIYADEPDALAEEREAEVVKPRSKHQQFMYELSTSGKSLADIQTEWHAYYVGLPDNEKHAVWQEFYEANEAAQRAHRWPTPAPAVPQEPISEASSSVTVTGPGSATTVAETTVAAPAPTIGRPFPIPARRDNRTAQQIKQRIRDTVTAGGKLQGKHHLQSLLFGLGIGTIVIVIFLFGFFNEVVIAPFIQPSRTASATPIIVDPSAISPTAKPEIIIPKINLEIPVDFSQTSTNEATIENALENGIVHYPTTVMPGEKGNTAFFGHSSNNIFNPGKYKFAFVLLHELVPGDTFYITYNGTVYVYKVSSRTIVDPSDVGVLNDIPGKTATATLITCDPPGTSLHRLVVVGDQISPNPSGNASGSSTTHASAAPTTQLPGNGPTLWSRLWHSVF